MATEDDNFDIDIYGDGDTGGYNGHEHGDYKDDNTHIILDAPDYGRNNGTAQEGAAKEVNHSNGDRGAASTGDVTSMDAATQETRARQTPSIPQQGVKRKELEDRPSDPDATTALLVSDLYWWTTDDEIRGWIRQADCEGELKDVTFSEHKVNGKSKGQAFVEFTSPQAASAGKHKIESLGIAAQGGRKYIVNYTNPHHNPFRTLPKDSPMRKDGQARGGAGYNAPMNQNVNYGMNNMGGGYRGGRGGYGNRGAMSNAGMGSGGFGGNRNFSGGMGGFQGGPMVGGFQGSPMAAAGMPATYGGFSNRGNMMGGGMRGGPGGAMRGRGGGMAGPNMMGMPGMAPMGAMGMNPMAGTMNPMMGGMAGNMGMQGQGGFQSPTPSFAQGFFSQNQGVGDGSWNPHGAKRSRQE